MSFFNLIYLMAWITVDSTIRKESTPEFVVMDTLSGANYNGMVFPGVYTGLQ